MAFNIILTISATGLFTSYITCIACVFHRRLTGGEFPSSKFHLGVWGYFVNAFALAFLALAFIFLFFPAAPNPDPAGMNWGILIYGVAVIFATSYYLIRGRHEYEGPVHYVRWQTKQDINGEDMHR